MILDFFRRHEKLVYWVLLPAVVVPFVFYYGGSGLGSLADAGGTSAEFMNQPIPAEDVELEAARCFGSGPEIRRDPVALALATNRLVYLEAVRQGGLSAGDAEVARALDRQRARLGPEFPAATWSFYGPALQLVAGEERAYERVSRLAHPDGLFGALYRQRLAAWTSGQLTRRAFADLQEVTREELLLTRHAQILMDTAKTTAPELYQAYLEQNTRLKARYARLAVKACEALVPPTALSGDAVKAFFEARKDQAATAGGYQVPERVTVAYLLADRETINRTFPADPADVEAFYSAHREAWRKPGGKEVKPLDEVRDDIVRELNRDKIQARADDMILGALEAPESEPFAATAARLSMVAGTGTIEPEGTLGIEALGGIRDLREALRDLEPGARLARGLVCEKGWCVLRLLARAPAHAPELEAVRDRVLADLRAQEARKAAEGLLARLKAGIGPDHFEGACADLVRGLGTAAGPFTGLVSGTAEPFQDPRYCSEALPEPLTKHGGAGRALAELKNPGEATEPAFSADGTEGVVLQLAERLPPEPNGFLKSRAALGDHYRDRVGEAFLRDWRNAVDSRTRLRGPAPRRGEAAPDDTAP